MLPWQCQATVAIPKVLEVSVGGSGTIYRSQLLCTRATGHHLAGGPGSDVPQPQFPLCEWDSVPPPRTSLSLPPRLQ